MGAPIDLPGREGDVGTAEEARTRRALLHMLEDLQRERNLIRLARQRWMETVDAVDSPLVVVDGDSRILRANQAYAGRAGMEYRELTGRPYWECFPRRSGPLEVTLPSIKTGAKDAPETEFRLDTGEIFLVRSYRVGETPERHVLHLFEDVTANRRSHEAVAAREQDLARAQRVASMGSWTWDVASDAVTWSAELYRIFGRDSGLPVPTFAGQAQMYTPESWARLQAVVAAMHSSGLPDEIDVEIVRPDGGIGWISLRCEPECDSGGRIVRVLGTALDITERRRSDEAIRASERSFRALFSNMLEGLAKCEMIFEDGRPVDCRYLEVNPAFEMLTGLKDVVGRTLGEVVPGIHGSNPELLETYARVSLGGKPERLETYVKALDCWLDIFAYNAGSNQFAAVFDNITERKRGDEALRESEARYRAMFDQAAVGMIQTSLEGVFVDVNPAFASMLGYSQSELEGHHFAEFTHPEDKAKSAAQKSVLARGGAVLQSTFEKRYVRKDGGTVWARVAVAAVRDDEGNPHHFVTLVEDITAHRQREEALRASEARFRAMFDQAAVGMIQTSLEGVLIAVNPAFASMLGYSEFELEGHHFADFTHPEDRSIRLSASAGDAASIQSTVEKRYFRKDGSTMWARVAAAAVGNEAGDPEYFVSLVEDITERKRAESALLRSHALLMATERIAEVGGFDWNIERHELYLSEEACRMFGRAPGYVPTVAAFVASIHPDHRQRARDAVAASVAGAKPLDMEFRIVRPDGTERVIDLHGEIQCDGAGKVVHMTGTSHDITDKKGAEQALRKSNRALKTLSNGNSVVIHAVSEENLLRKMCEVVVEAGYLMAWVGFTVQDAPRSVTPMACAGAGEEYLAEAALSWADTERGRGPVGRSIRTGVPQMANAILSDPSMAPWREQALKNGYASSVALPLADQAGVFGVLNIYAGEPDAFDAEEVMLLQDLAGDLAYGIANLRADVERKTAGEMVRRSLEGTIGAIGATMESRDPYTAGHQRRVAELAAAMALEMGLPAQVVEGVHFGALIHDLGKIQVPAEILSKPSHLTKLEFELIKTHPQAGYDIVKDIEFPWPVAQMVHHHHERLDGSGYPQGLKGDEIALEARILAVADVVEAMSSHRPYRPGLGIDAALKEIGEQRGKTLDPDAVDACARLFREKGFAFKTP
jgi:PAS domain S-box-containing protein